MLCFAFLSVTFTVKAQSNQTLDEIRDVCTELVVTTSQTNASAHKVIVFNQNGNANKLAAAISATGEGLEDVIEQLGRLRRIANGIVSNQYGESGNAYRSSSQRLQSSWNGDSRFPQEKVVLAGELMPLMGLIKKLSLDIRTEVMAMKNSSN